MINDLFNIAVERFEHIENIHVLTHERAITLTIGLQEDEEFNLIDVIFENNDIVVYVFDANSYEIFHVNYDDLIDIDEFIGLILCRILYNDK